VFRCVTLPRYPEPAAKLVWEHTIAHFRKNLA
jgi:hypothetical protein